MQEILKIAVIGTGHLGSIHARLLKNNEYARLCGIYDKVQEKSDALANELNCECFGSLDEAVKNSDAVVIAVDTQYHYDIALKCIEKGKPCFIEKPITASYQQAKELLAISKNSDVLIQIGHVERFNPALLALKNYDINPRFIEAHRLAQFKPRAIDVSVIHDLMIHDIDIMLDLIPSTVEKIDANGVAVITNTIDIANARISFKNGAVANLTASRITAKPMRKMRIFQQNAYFSIDFGKQDVEVFRIIDETENIDHHGIPATMLGSLEAGLKNKNIVFEKPPVPEINAIAEEQKAFVDAINNNTKAAVTAGEATEALRIAELIAEIVG